MLKKLIIFGGDGTDDYSNTASSDGEKNLYSKNKVFKNIYAKIRLIKRSYLYGWSPPMNFMVYNP